MLSIDIDEGVSIDVKEMSLKENDLSSISPASRRGSIHEGGSSCYSKNSSGNNKNQELLF